jgi:hypothetical protein
MENHKWQIEDRFAKKMTNNRALGNNETKLAVTVSEFQIGQWRLAIPISLIRNYLTALLFSQSSLFSRLLFAIILLFPSPQIRAFRSSQRAIFIFGRSIHQF